MRPITFPRASFLGLLVSTSVASSPAVAIEPAELVRAAIRLPCLAAPGTTLKSLAEKLPAELKTTWVRYSADGIDAQPLAFRMVFDVGGDVLTLQFAGASGNPDYVNARYDAGPQQQPVLSAAADQSCAIHTARRLSYDEAGRPEWLRDLDGALRPIGEPEPLNPPVPAGRDPPGIPIGIVDTGVNYLLPEIASRLARDPAGEILGYDYWDLDRRPFDVSQTPDPFFPGHHGTQTADLVLEEAPVAKLVPYRYPRQAMGRMPALIEDAAAHGVRLVNLSLNSVDRDDWLPFESAAAAHPEMLFMVAAGNHDRNIDQQPLYPAAFDLENMIVVTSATAEGRLSPGVNWGPIAVDLMLRGEDVLALDFDGERRLVSGSSYAAARATALAACLLADYPEWSTATLRAAILQEAEASEAGVVAAGFIPDTALGNRGACSRLQLGMR
jgi:subtilisin family serine protease